MTMYFAGQFHDYMMGDCDLIRRYPLTKDQMQAMIKTELECRKLAQSNAGISLLDSKSDRDELLSACLKTAQAIIMPTLPSPILPILKKGDVLIVATVNLFKTAFHYPTHMDMVMATYTYVAYQYKE